MMCPSAPWPRAWVQCRARSIANGQHLRAYPLDDLFCVASDCRPDYERLQHTCMSTQWSRQRAEQRMYIKRYIHVVMHLYDYCAGVVYGCTNVYAHTVMATKTTRSTSHCSFPSVVSASFSSCTHGDAHVCTHAHACVCRAHQTAPKLRNAHRARAYARMKHTSTPELFPSLSLGVRLSFGLGVPGSCILRFMS